VSGQGGRAFTTCISLEPVSTGDERKVETGVLELVVGAAVGAPAGAAGVSISNSSNAKSFC